MEANIKYYLVSVDRLDQRAIHKLTEEERKSVICYAVNATKPKLISANVKRINEWQLPWHDNRYQTLQYYEYGAIVHCLKNPELVEDLTHIGLLHYDVFFPENSVNEIKENLTKYPHKILYNTWRKNNQLFMDRDHLNHLGEFMSDKLSMEILVDKVWEDGWISEALTVTPIDVYLKFGKFLLENQYEIENILNTNRWGIMNRVTHRLCGFTERMWGMYLVSTGLEMEQMPIIHEWGKYQHGHLIEKEEYEQSFKDRKI